MTLARRSAVEGVGTAILVLIGCGAIQVAARTQAFGHVGVSAAFGGAVALLVAATSVVGGAHLNPAVTVGLWSIGRVPLREVAPYVAAQLTGAVLAAALLSWLLGPVAAVGATVPSVNTARAVIIEAGFTAVLGLVIMGAAVDTRGRSAATPLMLGVTVFVGALVTGPLTGGSFNPARSFGPALASGTWTAHWVYWAAPLAGMLVAMHGYRRGAGLPPA